MAGHSTKPYCGVDCGLPKVCPLPSSPYCMVLHNILPHITADVADNQFILH